MSQQDDSVDSAITICFVLLMISLVVIFALAMCLDKSYQELREVKKEAVIRNYAHYDVSNASGEPRFAWKPKVVGAEK